MPYKNKEDAKQYYIDNREKIKEYKKQYYIDNKEYYKQHSKQYYIDNKEYHKQYYQKNKEYYNQYYIDNKEHRNQYSKQWKIDNKEHMKQYQKQKRITDLKFNLNHRMSCAIWATLKGNKNGKRWEDLTGYTVKDLKKRLQSTMPEGYTWKDYLDGKLHIDHIIPKSVFNFTKYTHIDFRNCWSLSNLQLLPAEENLRKNAKLEKPFQPALKMAIQQRSF